MSHGAKGPFLVDSRYTIWTHGHKASHTSYAPWPLGQFGADIAHGRYMYVWIAHNSRSCQLRIDYFIEDE